MDSNRKIAFVKIEINMIQKAQESAKIEDLATCLRRIDLERLERDMEEARKLAIKRSGYRGLMARKQWIELESKVTETKM